MSNLPTKLISALGFSALMTLVLTHFLNMNHGVTKSSKGGYPQTVSDSNKNIFEGTFQPAFFNINVNVNNHNQ